MENKRLKKGILVGMATVMLTGVLAGCKDDKAEEPEGKVYTEEQYKKAVSAYNNVVNKYKVLETKYKANQVDIASTSMSEVKGTGDIEFSTINQIIKFPNKLVIPQSSPDITYSSIKFGSRYSIKPSSNWVAQIDGAKLNLEHPSKIRGSIKSVRVSYDDDHYPTVKDIQKQVTKFYNGYKKVPITYRSIFYGEKVRGVLSTAQITVDKKKHVINAGYFLDGDYSVTFIIDYEENNTGTQQELVESLLTTITHNGNTLKLE